MTLIESIIERIILANLDINEVVKVYKEVTKAKADYQATLDKANKVATETVEIPTNKESK